MRKITNLTPARVVNAIYSRLKPLVMGFTGLFVNYYYGNAAGLKANYGELRELAILREAFACKERLPTSVIVKSKADHLWKKGFLLLDRAATEDEISSIVYHVQAGFCDPDKRTVSPNRASFSLIKPENIPKLEKLLDQRIKDIVATYYGCGYRINTIRVWRNHHVPDVDGSRADVFSNTFHHDNYKVTGLRVFVLLSDGVTRETGAFRFHDRPASMRIVRSFSFFHRFMLSSRMINRLLNPKTLRFFEGNAGDIAIVNTQHCLHAASIPREGTFRDILQFELYPDRGPLKPNDELFSTIPIDQ